MFYIFRTPEMKKIKLTRKTEKEEREYLKLDQTSNGKIVGYLSLSLCNISSASLFLGSLCCLYSSCSRSCLV